MTTDQASTVYTHGHHASVLRSHARRTASDSAAYLLPVLRPGMRLLDVGCGPATITADLAAAVAPGEVVAVDSAAAVLATARATLEAAGIGDVRVEQADVMDLPFDDDTFDVVHAHQVLQHLTDPVGALREMRRVTRPGGWVAVRDADYGAFTWYPPAPGLDDWLELYHEVTAANRAEADAGRRLLAWVLAAGFDPDGVRAGGSAWCWASPEDRAWWSGLWSERVVASDFARQAREHGLADEVALESLAEAWTAWGTAPDGWFLVPHGEVLARA